MRQGKNYIHIIIEMVHVMVVKYGTKIVRSLSLKIGFKME